MGSSEMKLLPVGLSLFSAVYGFSESECYVRFSSFSTDEAIAAHCASNPGLGDYCKSLRPSLDVCPFEVDEEDFPLEDEYTNFSDNSMGYASDDGAPQGMIGRKSGGGPPFVGSELPQWIKDVFQNCRETGDCEYPQKWEVRALPRISQFQKAIDSTFKHNEPDRYGEYMAILNDKCFVSAQQCEQAITVFTDVTVPTYDNSYKTECIRCVVVTMTEHWHVSHVDATNSGLDSDNCMGNFCKALDEMRARLEAKVKTSGGAGFNNALSADFGEFETWPKKAAHP